jgi:branched-chain amino acid aminotransferase
MPEPYAYLNGKLLPFSEAAIPVTDAGFTLGVTVAEQLRTFCGRIFRLSEHLERLERSLKIVGVTSPLTRADFERIANELVARNIALTEPGNDLGLSMYVTPGVYSTFAKADNAGPLVGMHTYPLPFHQWQRKYEQGETLVVTKFRQVPGDCWPPELKCRSRMHYYLADKQAREIEPSARALMLDLQGFVTEASTANLLVYYRDVGLVSPPRERILPGISVAVVEELARKIELPFVHRDLTEDDLAAADEVLLTSTSPCVWPVTRLNGRPIGNGKCGEVARRLLSAWSELVGLDIEAQAARFAGG